MSCRSFTYETIFMNKKHKHKHNHNIFFNNLFIIIVVGFSSRLLTHSFWWLLVYVLMFYPLCTRTHTHLELQQVLLLSLLLLETKVFCIFFCLSYFDHIFYVFASFRENVLHNSFGSIRIRIQKILFVFKVLVLPSCFYTPHIFFHNLWLLMLCTWEA